MGQVPQCVVCGWPIWHAPAHAPWCAWVADVLRLYEANAHNKGRESIAGCLNDAKQKGWCHMHYSRWRRTGDPELTLTMLRAREAR